MRLKAFSLFTVLSVGFLLAGVVSMGTVTWCQVIGGCKFGKYEAKVTITDAKTQEPLANRRIKIVIGYGSKFFINVDEGQTTVTDSEGQASVEVDRAFFSPLVISVVTDSPKARAQFALELKDIREDEILTQVEEEYIAFEEDKRRSIKLVLEVGNWSLGSARKGIIEE
jgi:predicted RecB family endonuclease